MPRREGDRQLGPIRQYNIQIIKMAIDQGGITSYTAASPAEGDREELLLSARPVERVIDGVRRLWDKHNLAGGVMFEETRVYARVCVCVRETVEWSSARNVLQFVVV